MDLWRKRAEGNWWALRHMRMQMQTVTVETKQYHHQQIDISTLPRNAIPFPVATFYLLFIFPWPPTATSASCIVISSLLPFRSLTPIYYSTTQTHPLFFPLSLYSPRRILIKLLHICVFMAEEEFRCGSPHSLKNKIRSSLCLSCCFPHHRVKPRIVRSSSLQSKSRSTTTDFPHLMKEKCCNFISQIGRHRRRHSADFHYDALSYALNFDDDASDERPIDDLRSFSARLPASPPPPSATMAAAS